MILDVDSKIAADIALKNRLYVSGWALSGTLKSIRKNTRGRIAKIAVNSKGRPVSVCVLDGDEVMVFTRKSERRKGFASMLVNSLTVKKLSHGMGIEQCEKFFESLEGVECTHD